MADLTVAEFREHVETDAPDAAVQRILDDIYYEIVDRYGPVGATVTEILESPLEHYGPITLRRKPASIASIVEWTSADGQATRTLDASDYRVDGYRLVRQVGGTYSARGWSRHGTVVTYTPKDDTAMRKMVAVEVATDELAHDGYTSRRIGDYSETTGGQGTESLEVKRRRAMRRLAPRRGLVIA